MRQCAYGTKHVIGGRRNISALVCVILRNIAYLFRQFY
jgi:hypothetical protein